MRKQFQKLKAICILGILLISTGLNGQDFSLLPPSDCPFYYMKEDEVFYKDGENQILSCNYLIEMRLNFLNELIVRPKAGYGWFVFNNQQDANKYLHSHFKLIKLMGFNTIRIMNASIRPRYDRDELAFVINCPSDNNPDPVPNFSEDGFRTSERYVDLDEGGLLYLKQAMHVILEIASVYDLKVIWVMGGEARYFDGQQRYRSLLQHYGHTINEQYKNALFDIGNTFKSNPTLFAYDLFHELDSYGNQTEYINQVSVANSVNEINSVIKDVAPNHYTTVGLFNIGSFFKLGVSPFRYVDFFNFHLYESVDEDTYRSMPHKGMSVNRDLYYFYKYGNFEKPWMIGENGIQTLPNPEFNEIIESSFAVTEGDQRITVQNILNQSINCGSIGYTYWEFGNELGWQNYGLMKYSSTPMQVEINTNPVQTVECYLDYKEIVDPDFGNIFLDFTPSYGGCGFDQDYFYDFYNTPPNGNPTYTGVVKSNNVPIKNAIVKLSYLYDADGDGEGVLRDIFTFTDIDGEYEISLPDAVNNHARLTVSKYGYDMFYDPSVISLTYKTVQLNVLALTPIIQYDKNIIVPQGQTKVIDFERIIPDKIIVSEGATLIVRDTVYFDKNAYLKIMDGGKLILEEDASLTAISGSWKGVQAVGPFGTMPQIISTGKSSICKAECGISTYFDVRIELNNTDFIDNYFDVQINSNNSVTTVFNKCRFIVSCSGSNTIAGTAVRVTNSLRTKFIDCTFIDDRAAEFEPQRIGIESPAWSRIEIIGESETCRFVNLAMGVNASYAEVFVRNAEFVDNTHDMYLQYSRGTTRIENCNFLINNRVPISADQNDWYPFHVKLHICDPVQFYHCDFKDNRPEAITQPVKMGIEAWKVKSLKIAPSPLVQIHRSSFVNLLYGVYSCGETGNSLEVTNTDFVTSRGITTFGYSGFGSLKILNNNVTVKEYYLNVNSPDGTLAYNDEVYQRPYGVYLMGLTVGFDVEGNKFISENNDYNRKYGIVVKNTGAVANDIYRNEFVTLDNSVQAIGKNGDGESSTNSNNVGMEFICNKFSNGKTDIFISPDNSYPAAQIARLQGDVNRPAGNLFTSNASAVSIRNDIYDITYFTRKLDDPNFDIREVPINIYEGEAIVNVQTLLYVVEDEICPPTIGNTFKPVNPSLERERVAYSLILEDAIDDMLEDIVDGGNTGQILSSVLLADDNSAWLTYYELMSKSPYLSDTVLKDVSRKEQGLTVPMIRDILVANPQSAKKSDIKKLLKERNVELPEYMIAQIEAGENILSSKENLEIQKAGQRKIFDNSIMTLVSYYYGIKDSLPSANDSIVSLLELRKEPKYLLLLSDYYASINEFEKAKSNLQVILKDFNIKDYDRTEISNLISFYEKYPIILANSKNDLLKLDVYSIEILKQFAQNDDMAGYKARAMLQANGKGGFVFPIYEPGIIVSPRSIKLNDPVGRNEPYFNVYPNPAIEYVYVDYKLAEQLGTIQIVITDMSGKVLLQRELIGMQDIVILKTIGLQDGTYNCTLYNGNKAVFTNKLVLKQ